MKNIFDYKHVQGCRAICLLNAKTKEVCGRIIANFSDNPAGSVCAAQVMLYHNAPVKPEEKDNLYPSIGKAGGYGYDKLSSAIYESLNKMGLADKILVSPASGNQKQAFEDAGFIYIEVC